MKKIIMSLMVIAVTAGLIGGGLLADFSDIETSRDNYFSSGSMDLRVSDYLGVEYDDPRVPAFFQITDAWPCCSKDIVLDLHNAGQGFQWVPYAYLHIKNLECYGVEPEKGGILCPDGMLKPEPEYAAEFGLNPVGEKADGSFVYPCVDPTQPASATNPSLLGGTYGENCEFSKHVDVKIFIAGPYPYDLYDSSSEVPPTDWVPLDLSKYDTDPADGVVKMNELVCHQIELAQIPSCNEIWVNIVLHLQDIPEAWFGWDLFDETNPAEAKWDHWPTNALMKDGMEFDMSFELLQNRLPDP